MAKVQKPVAQAMTVEEYIRHELKAERRSEYVNGHLFEMPGEKDINNEIALFLGAYFLQNLKTKGFFVYTNDVKVGVPGGNKYYYPDVFVTKEGKADNNRYIKYEPELIVEVISPSTHITDTVDKYVDYTAIPSLKYYLIVEPETVYVSLYSKNAEGKWEAMSYVRSADVIPMPLLDLLLPLSEVYR